MLGDSLFEGFVVEGCFFFEEGFLAGVLDFVGLWGVLVRLVFGDIDGCVISEKKYSMILNLLWFLYTISALLKAMRPKHQKEGNSIENLFSSIITIFLTKNILNKLFDQRKI